MTMHKAFHPRDDVDRLYVSRKEGVKWLQVLLFTTNYSIKSKQLSSVSICRTHVFARFSGHDNSIHNTVKILHKIQHLLNQEFIFFFKSNVIKPYIKPNNSQNPSPIETKSIQDIFLFKFHWI